VALPFTWLDVFAAEPLTGNQLAVVLDADGLGEEAMLAFARETGLSETTFVQGPSAPGRADYRNRIWWANGELPFAGHPTLGTAVAVALRRGEGEARYVQETPAGLQPVEVAFTGERSARASVVQEPAVFGEEPDPGLVARVAGLEPDDLAPGLPPQVVSTGLSHVVLPLAGADALERCAPAAGLLDALLRPRGCATLYAFHAEPDLGFARARGFFVTPAGLREDPATGSAAGPLCAYLWRRAGGGRIIVDQGTAIGRPSRLEAEPDGDRVRVAGDVVVVAEGVVHL
jgi:trans-2,3-dihydro-3-hydroxyanthranilate isomerase